VPGHVVHARGPNAEPAITVSENLFTMKKKTEFFTLPLIFSIVGVIAVGAADLMSNEFHLKGPGGENVGSLLRF